MAIIPVNRERHGTLRWRAPQNFSFAAQRMLIPLVGAELPAAALTLPIAFVQQQDRYVPAAVVALERDQNLFVAEDGRWLARYVPAELRAYPFTMQPTDDGRQVLCVDEDSACLTDSPDATPLFTEGGAASQRLSQVLEFLSSAERNRAATALACAALQTHGVIAPWPISVRSDSGERKIEGLFRGDEAALNALSDEAFLEIRRAGGLAVIYPQLMSMQHLRVLADLAAARAQRTAPVQFGQDLDLSWMDGDTIKLGFGPGS
jgi:hypothetical protein